MTFDKLNSIYLQLIITIDKSHPLSIETQIALYNFLIFLKWSLFLAQPIFIKYSSFLHICAVLWDLVFFSQYHNNGRSSRHLKNTQSKFFNVLGSSLMFNWLGHLIRASFLCKFFLLACICRFLYSYVISRIMKSFSLWSYKVISQ